MRDALRELAGFVTWFFGFTNLYGSASSWRGSRWWSFGSSVWPLRLVCAGWSARV